MPFHWLPRFGFMTKSSEGMDEKEKFFTSFGLRKVAKVLAKGIQRLERKCFVFNLLSAREVDSREFEVRIYLRFLSFIQSIPCQKNCMEIFMKILESVTWMKKIGKNTVSVFLPI